MITSQRRKLKKAACYTRLFSCLEEIYDVLNPKVVALAQVHNRIVILIFGDQNVNVLSIPQNRLGERLRLGRHRMIVILPNRQKTRTHRKMLDR